MFKLSRYEIGQLIALCMMPISTGVELLLGIKSYIDNFLFIMVGLTAYLVLVKIEDNKKAPKNIANEKQKVGDVV